MKRLGRVIERLSDIGGDFSGWLVFLMMLLVLFEVFMRYVVGQPPIVADEFSAYMLVGVSFLGLAYTWKEKGHVRITALVERLPAKVANWLRLMGLVFAFAFTLVLVQSSCAYLAFSFKLGMVSDSWLRVPLQWPQMTLPIGYTFLGLLLIVVILKAIMRIRSGESIEEKTG